MGFLLGIDHLFVVVVVGVASQPDRDLPVVVPGCGVGVASLPAGVVVVGGCPYVVCHAARGVAGGVS